jgi:lysophospholipase L1-like esterase
VHGVRAVVRTTLGLLAVTAVSIAAMELLLRMFFPMPPGEAVHQAVHQSLSGLQERIVFERNAFGFRSLSMTTREKPPGTVRIIALGGSTTDQQTQSTVDTWSGLLEQRLRRRFADRGVRIEVAALGRGGWKTDRVLGIAKGFLLDFEPDLVLTFLGINDLALNGGPDYVYAGLEQTPEAGALPRRRGPLAAAPPSLTGCSDRWQLCRRLRALRIRIDSYLALRQGRAVEWHSRKLPERRAALRAKPLVEEPRREPDPIREFEDGMRELLRFLASAGVDVVVMGQPVLWHAGMSREQTQALWFAIQSRQGPVRASGVWLEREMSRYNDMQAALAREAGVPFVDLDRMVPKDLDHFFDDCHLTDGGSRLVAERLEPVVAAAVTARVAAGSSR